MRIVIDARELRATSGRYVEMLINYLQKIDKVNEYFILLKPKDMASWQPTNANFQKVSCDVKEFTFAEQFKLMSQVRGLKPDLVHFTFPQQPIWYRGKTITTIHDLTTLRFDNPAKNILIFRIKQKVYSHVINRAVHKASHVITPSQYVKDDLVKFSNIDSGKVTVTYESADPIKDKSEPLAKLKNEKYLMYVGRPTPHKNLEKLIDAYGSLKTKYPDLKLVLAGKKDLNYTRIEMNARKRGINGIVFTGFVSEGQLKWLYENCSAYLFPSLSEGFGLPGLEAMLNNAPVLSSNATCLPEIYGDAASYFDPLDANSIIESIEDILSNEKLREDFIKKGRNKTKEYSWERMAKQTLDLYNQTLSLSK
jgi:glycosyltransferase involved in cell wall biosynthesis